MKKFRSFPLKLAVIEALMEQDLLKKEMTALQKLTPGVKARGYCQDLDIPDPVLAKIKDLSFEGGNEIYRMLVPEWDGEDDQFTVRDLGDLVHMPNLRSLRDTVLVEVTNAAILLELPKLASVDLNHGSSIHDAKTIAELEKRGIRLENKPEVKRKSAPKGPDPKLRLALDYDRAQELLWDEGKPKAALQLLEKILDQHPRDVDSWFEKGNALAELGRHDEAAIAWQHCLALRKKYPNANYNLANYYKDQGKAGDAMSQIDAAIQNGMKSDPDAWHFRGQLHLDAGKQDEAISDLRNALKFYQKNLKNEDEHAENLVEIARVQALLAGSRE